MISRQLTTQTPKITEACTIKRNGATIDPLAATNSVQTPRSIQTNIKTRAGSMITQTTGPRPTTPPNRLLLSTSWPRRVTSSDLRNRVLEESTEQASTSVASLTTHSAATPRNFLTKIPAPIRLRAGSSFSSAKSTSSTFSRVTKAKESARRFSKKLQEAEILGLEPGSILRTKASLTSPRERRRATIRAPSSSLSTTTDPKTS